MFFLVFFNVKKLFAFYLQMKCGLVEFSIFLAKQQTVKTLTRLLWEKRRSGLAN